MIASLRFGIPIPEGAPVSTQECANTSPIWYTPSRENVEPLDALDRADRRQIVACGTVPKLSLRGPKTS